MMNNIRRLMWVKKNADAVQAVLAVYATVGFIGAVLSFMDAAGWVVVNAWGEVVFGLFMFVSFVVAGGLWVLISTIQKKSGGLV